MKYLLIAASFVLLASSYLMNRQVKKLKERVETFAKGVNELDSTTNSLYRKLYPKIVYLDSMASKKVRDTMWYASYLEGGDTAWYCCSYNDFGPAPTEPDNQSSK